MVLLIEDELPMRRFLRAALASESYRLVEAGTARGRTARRRRAATPTSSSSTWGCPTLMASR